MPKNFETKSTSLKTCKYGLLSFNSKKKMSYKEEYFIGKDLLITKMRGLGRVKIESPCSTCPTLSRTSCAFRERIERGRQRQTLENQVGHIIG